MTTPANNKIFNSVLWAAVRVWGNRLGGIIIFFILARILSPEDMGIYAAIWAVVLFLEVFTDQGLTDAIIQKKSIENNQLNTVFIVNLGMAFVISIVIFLAADKIASFIDMPEVASPLRVAVLALIFNAFGFCQLALHRRNFKYRWLAIRTLIATLVSGAVGITMAYGGYGAWALVIQFILASLINLIWLWIRPIWKPSFDFTLSGLADLMRFSVKLMFSRLFEVTSTRAFELAIAAWLGAATLGIYSVGSRIYSIMLQLLSTVVLDVAHSGFSRIADNKVKFLDSYYKAVSVSAGLAVPVFIILSAVANEFCVAMFGSRWAESGEILHLLALLGAVESIQWMNSAAIIALGFTGIQFIVSLLKALVTILVLLIYGHESLDVLVFAYVITHLPLCPISFMLGQKHIEFNWKVLMIKVYPFILGSGAAYYAINYARTIYNFSHVWVALISLSFLGLLVYVLSIWLIRPQYLTAVFSYIRHKITV
ncbi:MAG: lipopolysaccharide biosynthesis protein [Methylophilaceae bacterium]